MRDALGRLWKVGQPDGSRGFHFLCYEKRDDGNRKVLAAVDAEAVSARHECGGDLFQVGNWRMCGKCAADASERR